nr:reverse transcriptase domain-containing protein [Tanacetum cinerariifolium]
MYLNRQYDLLRHGPEAISLVLGLEGNCIHHPAKKIQQSRTLDTFIANFISPASSKVSIKVNGVTDDALRLYLFPHSLTHHATDWFDPQRSESSSSITSSSDTEIAALKVEMAEINKNLMRVLQVNQQVKAATSNRETCGGPHSFSDCPATVGNTQNVYATGAYQGIKETTILKGITREGINSSREITKQTNMTSLANSILELKNMFDQFMKMNIASSSGSGTLPGNTITNPKEDLKVERETEATKDMVNLTNNESTEDVQPPVVQTESSILTYETVNSPIIEPVASPVSAPNPNLRPSIPYPSRMQDQKLCDKANDQHFNADPRVPLILGRSFLQTGRALIDVFEGELTLRVVKEAIIFNLDQTSRYSANYNEMMANRIDIIDMACEEYSQ